MVFCYFYDGIWDYFVFLYFFLLPYKCDCQLFIYNKSKYDLNGKDTKFFNSFFQLLRRQYLADAMGGKMLM